MKPRYLIAALAVAALVAFLILRRGGEDGTTTSSASGSTAAAGTDDQGRPARDLPVEPTVLPHGVPTRAQANTERAEPPPRALPEESNVATPLVADELVETVGYLTERARSCATGMTVDVEVRMTFREGTAYVREAKIAGASLGEALDQCIVEKLTGHSWTVGADDKVFKLTIVLAL